jgi:hypothetical protein
MRRLAAPLTSIVALGALVLVLPGTALAAPTISSASIVVYACPASIQTPADLDAAGGPDEVCAVGGRPGDFGTLEDGFTWRIAPIEFDLQASLRVHGARLSNPEPTAGGSCNTTTMTCNAFQAYGWFNFPAGKTKLTEATVPPGYGFGWAVVYVDGQPASATTDVAARSVTLTPPRGAQSIFVQFINIVP